MPEPIISIQQIEAEARKAATEYDNVNDACPYSFYTEAGRTFRHAFQTERLKALKAQHAQAQGSAT